MGGGHQAGPDPSLWRVELIDSYPSWREEEEVLLANPTFPLLIHNGDRMM